MFVQIWTNPVTSDSVIHSTAIKLKGLHYDHTRYLLITSLCFHSAPPFVLQYIKEACALPEEFVGFRLKF